MKLKLGLQMIRVVCGLVIGLAATLAASAQTYMTFYNLTFGTYVNSNNAVQQLQLDLYLPINATGLFPTELHLWRRLDDEFPRLGFSGSGQPGFF